MRTMISFASVCVFAWTSVAVGQESPKKESAKKVATTKASYTIQGLH